MSHRFPDPPTPSSLPPGAAHLAADRLAALADEAPTSAEAGHLAGCGPCRREVAAYHALRDSMRLERDRVAPPLTSWDALGARLRAEGLVQRPEPTEVAPAPVLDATVLPLHAPSRPARRWSAGRLARAAAVLLVAGGGIVVGRLSAGAAPVPSLSIGAPSAAATVSAILADSAPPPSSTDEAMAILTRAERDYRVATAYLADETAPAEGASDRPEVYQRRLAVMDEVASLTRAALAESPHDPVLNQYYLASLGAREATLRHLATSLPTGSQLSRF